MCSWLYLHAASIVGSGLLSFSGLALEVSAPHDDCADIALNWRHGFKGGGAAVVAGMLVNAAHAAFGVVGHGVTSRRAQLTHGPPSVSKIPRRNHSGPGASGFQPRQ